MRRSESPHEVKVKRIGWPLVFAYWFGWGEDGNADLEINRQILPRYTAVSCVQGTLAEWLRRGPAKAVGYAFVSSNLTGVDTFRFCRSFLLSILTFNSEELSKFYFIYSYCHNFLSIEALEMNVAAAAHHNHLNTFSTLTPFISTIIQRLTWYCIQFSRVEIVDGSAKVFPFTHSRSSVMELVTNIWNPIPLRSGRRNVSLIAAPITDNKW